MEKETVSTGTIWEEKYSYSRAVRVGDRILVAGTTATDRSSRLVGEDEPATQADYIIDKIEGAINDLGGRLVDVVRVRVYVSSMAHWEPVATVLGRRFADINPASTLVEARLIGDEYLVEIEAEAIIGAGGAL